MQSGKSEGTLEIFPFRNPGEGRTKDGLTRKTLTHNSTPNIVNNLRERDGRLRKVTSHGGVDSVGNESIIEFETLLATVPGDECFLGGVPHAARTGTSLGEPDCTS